MIHKIWMGLFAIGIVYGFFSGTTSAVNDAILAGAQEAINLLIYLAGIMVFWTGILQVANHAKMLDLLCKVLTPVTRFLYPKLKAGHPALKYLTTNMVSNLLGLGSAATPTGLKAMKELQATNPDPGSRIKFSRTKIVKYSSMELNIMDTTNSFTFHFAFKNPGMTAQIPPTAPPISTPRKRAMPAGSCSLSKSTAQARAPTKKEPSPIRLNCFA